MTAKRMQVPMNQTPCDQCMTESITRAYAWKDEAVGLWVGFCSKQCRDAFCGDDAPAVPAEPTNRYTFVRL